MSKIFCVGTLSQPGNNTINNLNHWRKCANETKLLIFKVSMSQLAHNSSHNWYDLVCLSQSNLQFGQLLWCGGLLCHYYGENIAKHTAEQTTPKQAWNPNSVTANSSIGNWSQMVKSRLVDIFVFQLNQHLRVQLFLLTLNKAICTNADFDQ